MRASRNMGNQKTQYSNAPLTGKLKQAGALMSLRSDETQSHMAGALPASNTMAQLKQPIAPKAMDQSGRP